MALHTDEPHPHVHVLVKAVSEQGVRLNIRKATLRLWRSEFARHLREQGVRANATDRLARGRMGRAPSTEVYRGMARGALTKNALRQNPHVVEQSKRSDQREILSEVRQGWASVAAMLVREHPLAQEQKRNNPDPPSYSR